MKRIMLALMLTAFLLVACSSEDKEVVASPSADKKVYEVKFTHVVSENTPKGRAANFFAKRVEELTNGQIKVHVFPSAQLVDDDKVFQELKRNNVQLAAPSFSKFTPFAKEFNLWDIPFLFRDTEHLHNVMDGEVGEILKNIVRQKGYIALDYWDAGFKQFSTNKKPIILPSDAEGQKMRIMSSKVIEEQTKAIKAIPQVLPFGEVYSALQTGVVDASENPLSNLYNSKFYEVQSSITISNHGYLGYLVVASEKFWNALPKDLQERFMIAMREATEYEREESAKEERVLLDRLRADDKTDTQVFELDAAQKQQWQDTMIEIYPRFYDIVGKELIDKTINTQ